MAAPRDDRRSSGARQSMSANTPVAPYLSSTASSASLGRFTSVDQGQERSGNRKRPRSERTHQKYQAPDSGLHQSNYRGAVGNMGDFLPSEGSPMPLVDSRYRLSGGRDTLTREDSTGFEEFDNHSDRHFRRQWTSVQQDHSLGHQRVTVEALHREDSGRKRRRTSTISTEPAQGWGSFVFNVMGGIAGKVLNYWRGGEFSGFQAGGGVGYTMTPTGPKPISSSLGDDSVAHGYQSRAWSKRMAPIPGQYPEEEEGEQPSAEILSPVETPGRAAKRLQTTQTGDWVVVDPDPESLSFSKSRAPSSRRSLNSRPLSAGRSVPSRRSNYRGGRLSSVSYAGSPHLARASEASVASPRSPQNSPQQGQSPASLDVQRYQARRKHEDKQNDASMRKLNRQLKAMIQEGKAALATKYEVGVGTDSDEDEGFSELNVDM